MTRDLEAVDGERSAATEIPPSFYNIQFPTDFGVYVAPNCVTHTLNGTVDPQFHRSRRKVERHDLSWLHMERPEIFPPHLLAVLYLDIDIPKQSRGEPMGDGILVPNHDDRVVGRMGHTDSLIPVLPIFNGDLHLRWWGARPLSLSVRGARSRTEQDHSCRSNARG